MFFPEEFSKYSSTSHLLMDFKEELPKIMENINSNVSSAHKKLTSDVEILGDKMKNLDLDFNTMDRCKFQLETFSVDLSNGDRCPSPIEGLRRESINGSNNHIKELKTRKVGDKMKVKNIINHASTENKDELAKIAIEQKKKTKKENKAIDEITKVKP
jgi:Zn-dependent M32 family carboxypeptidase